MSGHRISVPVEKARAADELARGGVKKNLLPDRSPWGGPTQEFYLRDVDQAVKPTANGAG